MKGHRVVQSAFNKFKSKDLAGIFVWIPMLDSDGVASANEEASSFTDSRIAQYWDANKAVGTAYRQLFGLTKTAWDMYLVYNPGVIWKGSQPPKPTFYMHQMNSKHGTNPAKFLKPDVFYKNVQTILTKNNEEV